MSLPKVLFGSMHQEQGPEESTGNLGTHDERQENHYEHHTVLNCTQDAQPWPQTEAVQTSLQHHVWEARDLAQQLLLEHLDRHS